MRDIIIRGKRKKDSRARAGGVKKKGRKGVRGRKIGVWQSSFQVEAGKVPRSHNENEANTLKW